MTILKLGEVRVSRTYRQTAERAASLYIQGMSAEDALKEAMKEVEYRFEGQKGFNPLWGYSLAQIAKDEKERLLGLPNPHLPIQLPPRPLLH